MTPKQHFAKDAALDEAIRIHFGATLEDATDCELLPRAPPPKARLAEVLAQLHRPGKNQKPNVKPVDRQQCPPP